MDALCMQPDSLQLFLSMLDMALIEIASATKIIVHAEDGPVSWEYLSNFHRFCIDGIPSQKLIMSLTQV